MNLALFEDSGWTGLLPLTWLRPAFELRCGRDRLIDKLCSGLSAQISKLLVRDALRATVEARSPLAAHQPGAPWCFVNSRALITAKLEPPPQGSAWVDDSRLIAATVTASEAESWTADECLDDARLSARIARLSRAPAPAGVRLVQFPWNLVSANARELLRQLTRGGEHAGRVYAGAHLLNHAAIRIAEGAVIKPGVVLDAENGPIEIDSGAQIQPNAVVEGPCYVGEQTIIRPTAAVRPNTTIGPICRVGGEVEGSIFQGFANKQHDGFLGHSFVGEWVNLGADTVTSDLKNTYGTIRIALNGVERETGERFIGSIIGDHSKTGIGTILPTGCVLGVAANVFTRAAAPKFVPSFAWLTDEGLTTFRVQKAIEIARNVMQRRGTELTEAGGHLLAACQIAARSVEAAGWPRP
ncbi:MAG: putative sugar nucleotidyl transferase [Phycisphaerae bacterium]